MYVGPEFVVNKRVEEDPLAVTSPASNQTAIEALESLIAAE
jgi:hypothetical protein